MITLADIRKLRSRKAVEKLVADNYSGQVTSFVADIDTAVNSLLRTDLKHTMKLVVAANEIASFLPKQFLPRFIAMEGRVNHWMGNYEKALSAYTKAAKLYKQQREYQNLARLGRGLMDVYMYLGKYQEAIKVGKQSLRYFKRTEQHNDAAMVMTNIGNVYHRMDNNRLALQYYDKAKEIFAKGGGIPLAIVEYNRANIYANLNQFDKARQLYQTAADLYKQAGMSIAEAQAIYSLAYLYFLEDRFTEALRIFEKVYDSFVSLGDRKSAAVTQLDLVELNIQLNQPGSAIMLGEQIVPEFKKLGMRYERAKALYFAAWARLKLGDIGPATKQLTEAEKLFAKEKNLLWLGMVSIARSKVYLARRQFTRSMKEAQKAMGLFKRSGDARRAIDAATVQVETALASGDFQKAIRQAKRLLKKELVSYQKYNVLYILGQGYLQNGQPDKALEYFTKAVTQVEKMLVGLYPDEIRFFFALDKFDCYRQTVECLIKLNRTEDAFLYNLTALKAINEQVTTGSKQKIRAVPKQLLESRDKLRATLKKYNHLSSAISTTATRASVSYQEAERKLWEQERRIRLYRYPEPVIARALPVELDDIRMNLSHDETLVSFVKNDEYWGAFCATNAQVVYKSLDLTHNEITELIRKLHYLSEKTVQESRDSELAQKASRYYLNTIYNRLLQPLVSLIPTQRVIFVVEDTLAQIPFGILQDNDGCYLRDKYHISIIADPMAVVRRKSSQVSFVKKHNAIFAVSSNELPAVDIEGQEIKKLFDSAAFYTGVEAQRHHFEKELKRANGFVHIAAHASRSSENPLFSRILMSDGPFFPFDLFGYGIRAQLVTLSGCQTAAPGLYYGNSFSLAKAFYQAGSRFVLASLWPVSDKLSMIFMIEFYKALYNCNNVPQAYNEAVTRMSSLVPEPTLWGSFVLIGL